MLHTNPTTASNELLNTALLGLNKKDLSLAALPPALHHTLQTVMQQAADPVEAFVEAANLVLAYEYADSTKLITSFTPEERLRLQAVLNDSATLSTNAKLATTTTTTTTTTTNDHELQALLLRVQQHHAPMPLLPFDHSAENAMHYHQLP